MKILKTWSLTWWQTGAFKLGSLSLGIAIGVYWHQAVSGFVPWLFAVAVVTLGYIAYVWWRQ